MNPQKQLTFGNVYSKVELSNLLNETTLKNSREGIYNCKNSKSTFLFVTLDKLGKKQSLHYNDYFEEDYFHWDSQNKQHINTPGIQKIVTGQTTTFLFIRIHDKNKGKTNPFLFCGRLIYDTHDKNSSNPVHVVFQNIDYDDNTDIEDLIDIYLWRPNKHGKKSSTKINKVGIISKRRKHKKPNVTERSGLVTSRVGQGYYRQQILDKWNGTCPVSGCTIKKILISSHIVSWSESNDDERLDVENGILLSPNIDSLFDKHLISFEDDGSILISDKLDSLNRESLNINDEIKIPVSEGMKKYLKRHREKFNK